MLGQTAPMFGEARNPVGNYMFKVKNRNTQGVIYRTIKTPERRQWSRRDVSFLLTLNIFHTLFY